MQKVKETLGSFPDVNNAGGERLEQGIGKAVQQELRILEDGTVA